MTVLMIHYHLRPGGVSTVLRRQLQALAKQGIRVHVLSGEAPAGEFAGEFTLVPELAYDPPGASRQSTADTVAALAGALRRCAAGFEGKNSLLHVHNATIRKNAALLPALCRLAAEGYRMLLQVHDLAEDWRPDVYAVSAYPEGCWWAAINRRDQERLSAACGCRSGPGRDEVFFLPNPVFDAEALDSAWRSDGSDRAISERRLLLYPVRGIRRKNLGEMLLLSLFLPADLSIGATLPPTNPRDFEAYKAWQHLARTGGLPVTFDMGLSATLDDLYRSCRAVISTSVKEGFGLSFLEPLVRGRPVLGRRIPNAVRDFEAAGLDFSGLYDSITIPANLYDKPKFQQRLQGMLDAAFDCYGLKPEFRQELAGRIEELFRSELDFAKLDETAQAEVIRLLAGNNGVRRALLETNPWLAGWWQGADVFEEPPKTKLGGWSLQQHGSALAAIYQAMQHGSGLPAPDKELLLRDYLRTDSLFGVGL